MLNSSACLFGRYPTARHSLSYFEAPNSTEVLAFIAKKVLKFIDAIREIAFVE